MQPPEYWRGYGDHIEGDSWDANPYREGTRHWAAWQAGWIASAKQGHAPAKPWWKSKSVLAGGGVLLVGLLSIWQKSIEGINPDMADLITVAAGYLTVALRAVTDSPLRMPNDKE